MNPHHRTASASTIASIIAAIAYGTSAHAAVIYSESFDYGANNGALVGQNGGTGFTEPWNSDFSSITYGAAGLTFSDLGVSGGRVTSNGENQSGNATVSRLIASNIALIYGSLLSRSVNTNQSTTSGGMVLGFREGNVGSHGYGIFPIYPGEALRVNAKSNINIGGNGTYVNQGQTYLTLYKIDQFAASITGWQMTEAQYDEFKVGGVTETELNDAVIGTSSSQLWARGFATDNVQEVAMYLTIYIDANDGVSATVDLDEFRLSDAGFDDLLASVPEPGSVALLALGAGLLSVSRKRR